MKHPFTKKRCAFTTVLFLSLQGAAFEALSHQVDSTPNPMMSSAPNAVGGVDLMGRMMGTPELISSVYALDVSAEQQQAINRAQDDQREAQWALMPVAIEKRSQLESAMADDKMEPALIGRLFADFSGVQRQLLELQITTQNRIKSVLTEDQKEQFRRLHQASLETMQGHGMFMDSLYEERAKERMEMRQHSVSK